MKRIVLSVAFVAFATGAFAQAGTGADAQRRDRTQVQEEYGRKNKDGSTYYGQDPNLNSGGYKQGCSGSGCNYGPSGTGQYAPKGSTIK